MNRLKGLQLQGKQQAFISLSTIFLVSVPYKIKPLEIIWPVNWHSLNETAKSRTMNIYTADKPLCKLLYL